MLNKLSCHKYWGFAVEGREAMSEWRGMPVLGQKPYKFGVAWIFTICTSIFIIYGILMVSERDSCRVRHRVIRPHEFYEGRFH